MSAAVNILHVANGDCTTEIIEAAGLRGATSVWADALQEGPVPGGVSDEELVRVRARYLAGSLADHDEAPSFEQIVARMMSWRSVLDDPWDEIVLWYEHDLFDQLNLIQLLSHLGQAGVPCPVSLVCIGAFPGRPDFKGLGQLTPDELAPLFETRQPVGSAAIALAERAWRAFRASDPRSLEEVLAGDTAALPFLAPALARHLEEYPSTVNGLGRSEQHLLELCRSPIAIAEAFGRMHDGESAFYVADRSFLGMARELAAASPPLLVITLESDDRGAFPRGTLALTAAGHEVLGGALDRVHRCGIDRWLGGVHLEGTGPAWRWDPGLRRLARG